MKNALKTALGMLFGLGLFSLPATSQAQNVSLKLEPGVAIPVTEPQSDLFHPGVAMSVKGLVELAPYADVGPTISFLGLPSADDSVDSGMAWGFGGGLRLKRPHDHENNTGSGFSAVSPWVDTDLQYVRTGDLNRVGLSMGVGAAVPTSDTRNLWVGPFVRYEDIFQAQKAGYDNSDGRILMIGVSLEISPKPAKKPVATPPVAESDRDKDGTPDKTDRCPDVPGPKDNFGCPRDPAPVPPAVVPETKLELQQKIQFDWDSANIRTSEHKALNEVVGALADRKGYKVRIEGHASSEGTVEHNNGLAQRRAEAVLDYLVSKGVPQDNLTAVGFGSRVPVGDNATEAGKVANRRVEFVVNIVLVKE